MNLELLGEFPGYFPNAHLTKLCYRIVRTELPGGIRRHSRFTLDSGYMCVQQAWHFVGGRVQRRQDCNMGFPNEGHSQNNIGARASGLQH